MLPQPPNWRWANWPRGWSDSLLYHFDRDRQYTSEQFQRLIADYGVTCSMNRLSPMEFERKADYLNRVSLKPGDGQTFTTSYRG